MCTQLLSVVRANLSTHILLHIFPLSLPLSLLRGAEQMGMHKAVKPQFGGGMRRFSCDEDNIYENIDSELCFFTSQVNSQLQCDYTSSEEVTRILRFGAFFMFQERQSIIKYWLDNLRAKQGEVLHNIHFLEGQPISMFYYDPRCFSPYFSWRKRFPHSPVSLNIKISLLVLSDPPKHRIVVIFTQL